MCTPSAFRLQTLWAKKRQIPAISIEKNMYEYVQFINGADGRLARAVWWVIRRLSAGVSAASAGGGPQRKEKEQGCVLAAATCVPVFAVTVFVDTVAELVFRARVYIWVFVVAVAAG
jgi:hypothetical protein